MHLGILECHKPFLRHCDLDLWPSFKNNCVQSISPILLDVGIPNLGWWFLLGWRSGAYHFESLWPWHWLLASFLDFSCYITANFPQMCLMLDQFLWGHSSCLWHFLFMLFFFVCWFFLLFFSRIPSVCQTVWIQIRPDILSGLIWVHTVCKGYKQMTLVSKGLTLLRAHIPSWQINETLGRVSEIEIRLTRSIFWSAVSQWWSAWLETVGPQVQASPAQLCCVCEQDTVSWAA